jgi:hypothetical protein
MNFNYSAFNLNGEFVDPLKQFSYLKLRDFWHRQSPFLELKLPDHKNKQ